MFKTGFKIRPKVPTTTTYTYTYTCTSPKVGRDCVYLSLVLRTSATTRAADAEGLGLGERSGSQGAMRGSRPTSEKKW